MPQMISPHTPASDWLTMHMLSLSLVSTRGLLGDKMPQMIRDLGG